MKVSDRQVPEQMNAIRQYKAGGELSMEQVDVPRPGPGEVLIKMEASPVNPSDLALIKGGYLERSFPFTPGLEGSGTVVEAGRGLFPRLRMGKRVACSPHGAGDGTWAEYMVTSAMNTAPLPKHISMEQGSMMLVNPMTAMAFIHLLDEGNHRAMVNNAAASSLGKMLVRLTKSQDITLINIVRREDQYKALKTLGASHVLNSTSPSFAAELKALAEELGATLFLDAVTGNQSAFLLEAAPRGSTLVTYARLSDDPFILDPAPLIKEEKQIVGFQLGNWLQDKGLLFKLRFINSVKRELGGALSSSIGQIYPLEKAQEAITYYGEHMSDGKIVLKIGSD